MIHDTPSIIRELLNPALFPAALATLFRVEGSSYRRCGARLLLERKGKRYGSISGGCLEDDLIERLRKLAPGTREEVIYDTTAENDLVWGVGLGCHGIVRVLLEHLGAPPSWATAAQQRLNQRLPATLIVDPSGTRFAESDQPRPSADEFVDQVEPPLRLAIFGAGEDARPLVCLAKTLGWTVEVRDPRPALASSERFPEADLIHAGHVETLTAELHPDPRTAAVIMTHSYRFDQPLLAALLPLGLNYLGLLGPRRRAERLVADAGLGTEALNSLRAPVGLDLGGDGPEAVALAIVSEIQAVFGRRSGRPLRERTTPIHHDDTPRSESVTTPRVVTPFPLTTELDATAVSKPS